MSDLSEYFRSQAGWRRVKAEEYPEDERNPQSAAALDSLAEYVEDEAEAGSVLTRLEPHLFEGPTLGGEKTNREVARYGFGYEVRRAHHEEFLEELTVTCIQDAYEFVREHADDPTETLFEFEIDAAREGVYLPEYYWRRRSHSVEYELEEAVGSYRENEGAD
jgi:hypothetical protein